MYHRYVNVERTETARFCALSLFKIEERGCDCNATENEVNVPVVRIFLRRSD